MRHFLSLILIGLIQFVPASGGFVMMEPYFPRSLTPAKTTRVVTSMGNGAKKRGFCGSRGTWLPMCWRAWIPVRWWMILHSVISMPKS